LTNGIITRWISWRKCRNSITCTFSIRASATEEASAHRKNASPRVAANPKTLYLWYTIFARVKKDYNKQERSFLTFVNCNIRLILMTKSVNQVYLILNLQGV